MENIKKNLSDKIIDYKRFAFVLVSVSVFLYLGAVLPVEEKTIFQTYTLMGGTIIMLGFSGMFFYQAAMLKKKLTDMDDERVNM
ncbi:YrhC family protein [Bacillus sp. SG-1]|uniref:YrhC family protein n=1 Tax=Bacillus sp. SG-1 TaxID=161544 RepID=UPI0002D70541|nr:YrhC family protein [Bacillus sp. SG-1]